MSKNDVRTQILKQVLPPLTAWAVGKVLEIPRVKKADRKAGHAIAKRARRAAKNPAWFAAGAAAFALGIGMMARATKK
jgi:hypothetical protein